MKESQFISSSPSIYCTFEANGEGTFIPSLMEQVILPILKEGFRINGNPYGKLIIRNNVFQNIKRYFEIWIPVERKDSSNQ